MKHRSQIYATDFNELILKKAKNGIYPLEEMKAYTKNYQQSGGKNDFSDYYTADYDHVILRQSLKEKVLFSSHNLVTDGVFGEMNLIFCRNVLIYFNRQLQNRVLRLFYDSLCPGGYLCLGSKESLKFTDLEDKFEPVAGREKIYRKNGSHEKKKIHSDCNWGICGGSFCPYRHTAKSFGPSRPADPHCSAFKAGLR